MRIKFKSTVQGIKCTMKIAVAAAAVALSFGALKDTAWAETVERDTEGGIKWEVAGNTLTISPAGDDAKDGYGSGVMKDYTSYESTGWYGKCKDVENIVIESGVTNISDYAFGNPSPTTEDEAKNIKGLSSVTIGEDVKSIGSRAFANNTIAVLKIYSTDLTTDKINNDSFMRVTYYVTDPEKLTLGVVKAECFKDSVGSYFEKFQADDPKIEVQLSDTDTRAYAKSSVTVDTDSFNITVKSYNLLGDDDAVSVKWKGTSTSLKAGVSKDKYDPTFAIATEFVAQAASIYAQENNNATADTDTKNFKFFDLSADDSGLSDRSAEIVLPTPSGWSDDFGNIWVLVRNNDGTYERLASVNTQDTITFTAPHFSPYALYYAGKSTSNSGTSGSSGDSSGDTSGDTSSSGTATNENCEISITTDYFSSQFFKWGIGSITDGFYGIPTVSSMDDIMKKFVTANSNNDQGYTVDTTHLKAFDLSSTIDGKDNTEKIDNLKVRVPVPSEWNTSRSKIQVLTIADNGKIEVVNDPGIYETNGTYYIEFIPPHFSPYALYLADTSSVTATTAATTTAAATTTTATTTAKATTTAATTKATTAASTTKATTKASGSGAQLDNTPGTGVKDFMWIAVPIAVMLMGVGIVFLARRNKKDLDD